jgi:hypothetical protein
MTDRLNFMTNKHILDVLGSTQGSSTHYKTPDSNVSTYIKSLLPKTLSSEEERNNEAMRHLWRSDGGKILLDTMHGVEANAPHSTLRDTASNLPIQMGRFINPEGRLSTNIEDRRNQKSPPWSFWEWLSQE